MEGLSTVGINDTSLLINFNIPVNSNGVITHYIINVEDATDAADSIMDVVTHRDNQYHYFTYVHGLSEQFAVLHVIMGYIIY